MRAIALGVMLLLVACGPRPNKEERRSTYGPPKNAQEASVRWPGEKIELRNTDGSVQLRLRRRTRRTRVFGPRVVPLGDVRRQDKGYIITEAGGTSQMRVEPDESKVDGEGAQQRWRVCPGADPAQECRDVIATMVPGATLEILRAGKAQATASSTEAGVRVSSAGSTFSVTPEGSGRFAILQDANKSYSVSGVGTPLTVTPALAGELSPLVQAALMVVIEDHHGTWSLNP